MKRFSICNSDASILFELIQAPELNLNGMDYLAKIKYTHYERSIFSERIWELNPGDIHSFLYAMQSMHRYLKGQAVLSSLGDDTLRLTIDKIGHISVEIQDGIPSYDGYVQICFEIDQSFLPNLIDQATALCTSE
ncbi:MAG: hypothetical protein IIT92_05045 [Bacteroidales bacterium]|jgi:hypothetical protein|nr:hypothetical protein [Prevotella sp.]MBQ5517752.1 hypothetical protein [Bacteroidales bacterium]